MKTKLIYLLLFLLAAAQIGVPRADAPSEVAQLRKQIQELRKELSELKKRVKELETRPRFVPSLPKAPPPVIIPPNPGPKAQRPIQIFPRPSFKVPDSWRPFEFNGQTYYLIPLR